MAAQPRKTGNSPKAAKSALPAKKPAVVAVGLPPTTPTPVVAHSTKQSGPVRLGKTGRPIPPNAGIGRPKGVPNKITIELRDMIRQALDEEGGVEYLRWASRTKPESFLSLLGRILPTKIEGSLDLRLADLLAEAAGFAVGK